MPPGRAKVGEKRTQGPQLAEEQPLTPYEQQHRVRCMRNNAMLNQLGLPTLKRMLANMSSISGNKTKSNYGNSEDSESEYDPSNDDTDDDNAKKGSTDCNKRTADMPSGGIKCRSKRVFAQQQTTRITRSRKTNVELDASLRPSDNFDGLLQATTEGGTPAHTNMANEDHVIPCPDGHNQMDNEDNGLIQIDNNMTNGGEAIIQPGVDNQLDNDVQIGENDRWERGVNMGHGLHRINRSLRGRLHVAIPEGMTRPVVPVVAAKFATECNIAVRNHVPVFKHWKDYKKKTALFDLFKGKLSAKFDMNTSDATVQKACSQMMKNALRQQRYRLKKKYFDPFPLHLVRKTSPIKSMTDNEWNDLVEHWKNPKKMETCQKNKDNRSKVKFHQTTGSRSYMVHVENLGDKYIDQEPDALDLFKECHYSKKKKGYTSTVQLAIDQMENKRSALTEDGQTTSTAQAVADVLAENTKRNMFLQNVGLQNACSRSSVQNLEAQLEFEKRANGDLREQLDVLLKKVQETEQARTMEQEEMRKRQSEMEESRIREQEEMKKKQAEMEVKLQLLLNQIKPS